jgi:hypothetical protein
MNYEKRHNSRNKKRLTGNGIWSVSRALDSQPDTIGRVICSSTCGCSGIEGFAETMLVQKRKPADPQNEDRRAVQYRAPLCAGLI